jgi:hypothetical protein
MLKLLILIVAVAVIIYMCTCPGKFKEGFESTSQSCKQVCFERHPDAARMYADADNDIAMTTIDKCVAKCQSVRGGNTQRTPSGSCTGCA